MTEVMRDDDGELAPCPGKGLPYTGNPSGLCKGGYVLGWQDGPDPSERNPEEWKRCPVCRPFLSNKWESHEIKKHLNNLVHNARYVGHGAEGICLISQRNEKDDPRYAVKFWDTTDDHNSSYHVWQSYAKWPEHVKNAVVRLFWCGEYNGRPITVTEVIEPTPVKYLDGSLPTTHIMTALQWFCDEFHYELATMIEDPAVGKRKDGSLVLFDIL